MSTCNPETLLQQAGTYQRIPPEMRDAVRSHLLCQWAQGSTDVGAAFAQTWADAITAAGAGTPSVATVTGIGVFVNALINTTVWPKIITMNVVAPDSVAISLYPLVHNAGYNPYLPYYSGAPTQPLLSVGGWKYPSTLNGIDTGILPANHFNAGTFGCTVYCSLNPSDAASRTMGCGEGVAAQPHTSIYTNQSGNTYAFIHRFGVGLNPAALPANPWPGYLSYNRATTTDMRLFIARSDTPHKQQAFSATANVNLPTALWRFLIFSWNNAGSPESATTVKQISFFALHQPLTLAESATLYAAVQTLRTAFGGGYV